MPEHDISPVPEPEKPRGTGHYQADDDIELPPLPESASGQELSGGRPVGTDRGSKSGGISSILGTAALIGALVIGGWLLMRGSSAERQHPNWQHVTAATEASNEATNYVVQVDGAGNTHALPSIEVSSTDADGRTTQAVRAALLRNDLAAANAALQAAQQLSALPSSDVQQPEITANSDLASAIKERRQEFFRLYVRDCCDEDGDVVEILVNGASFATVPMTHQGMTLSIPLARGNNTVTLRGVKDGGGGITISFQTSRGHYYWRKMRVGQEYNMGVVVK